MSDKDNFKSIKKEELLLAVNKSLPIDPDESDIMWWLAILPDAKRYIKRKIRSSRQRITELELQLAVHESRVSILVRDNKEGTATERKKIAEDKYYVSKGYVTRQREMNDLYALIEEYEADLENLQDKSFHIRKMADLFKVHMMYEDD